MSISPFSVRPVTPETDRRRARLVLVIATLGIAATLLAYVVSPGVRHAVVHAAHSVKGAVGHVLDRDKKAHKAVQSPPALPTPAKPAHAKAVHPKATHARTTHERTTHERTAPARPTTTSTSATGG